MSFLRPSRRRLLMIARPSLVAIRARKPWRRARTSWDGWYVRFMTSNRAWHGSSSLVLQQQEFRTPNKLMRLRCGLVGSIGKTRTQVNARRTTSLRLLPRCFQGDIAP